MYCSICYDAFKSASVLPCSHKFCWDCIVKWKYNAPYGGCPICREFYTLESIRRLPLRSRGATTRSNTTRKRFDAIHKELDELLLTINDESDSDIKRSHVKKLFGIILKNTWFLDCKFVKFKLKGVISKKLDEMVEHGWTEAIYWKFKLREQLQDG